MLRYLITPWRNRLGIVDIFPLTPIHLAIAERNPGDAIL